MHLLVEKTAMVLWQDLIKHAEQRCAIALKEDLESYLISLLVKYLTKPEIVDQVVAFTFLEGLQLPTGQRHYALQEVGDQCLLFAGLFPHISEKKLVKISYYVRLGKAAYSAISTTHNDLYGSLAMQFVVLMDVLQSIREDDLTPIEAYEQWNSVGSKRALKLLKQFTVAFPQKIIKND